jgi:hypothetical protein
MNTNFDSQLVSYLRRLATRRQSGVVSADDVQNFLTRNGFSGDTNERLSIVRRTLSNAPFRRHAAARSARPAARGRFITTYSVYR